MWTTRCSVRCAAGSSFEVMMKTARRMAGRLASKFEGYDWIDFWGDPSFRTVGVTFRLQVNYMQVWKLVEVICGAFSPSVLRRTFALTYLLIFRLGSSYAYELSGRWTGFRRLILGLRSTYCDRGFYCGRTDTPFDLDSV